MIFRCGTNDLRIKINDLRLYFYFLFFIFYFFILCVQDCSQTSFQICVRLEPSAVQSAFTSLALLHLLRVKSNQRPYFDHVQKSALRTLKLHPFF